MQKVYQYNNELKKQSRQLRKTQTDAERLLWFKLRGKQIAGYKFYRQFAIDMYILDFYCPAKKIAIEIDGSQHMNNIKYDQQRTSHLEKYGIRIIRFWDNEVFKEADQVLDRIYQIIIS
jgi:very-short-patch-repair endonuclease